MVDPKVILWILVREVVSGFFTNTGDDIKAEIR